MNGINRWPPVQPAFKKIVKAYGVMCFRLNNDKRIELCLVSRRCSYEYCEFVRYWCGRYTHLVNRSHIFDKMRTEEKIDIMSMDYDIMERRIMGNKFNTTDTDYVKRKANFEKLYKNNSKILIDLINKSRNISAIDIWEPPKGRPLNKNNCKLWFSKFRQESDIECAIRETYEEANLHKEDYKLFPDKIFTYEFIDNKVKYEIKYYLAVYTASNPPPIGISLRNQLQVQEISNVRWLTYEFIKLISKSDIPSQSHLEPFVKPIFKIAKKLM